MGLMQPWPEGRRITSPYGMRTHPVTGKRLMHRGVDAGGRFPVVSAGDGTVAHIGWSPKGGGHVVIIKHTNPAVYTVYYHGRTATQLHNGQTVKAGDFVYESGSTGMSTGDHLHFEVRRTRLWGTDVDPMPYLTEPYVNGGASEPEKVVETGQFDRPTIKAWQSVLRRDWRYRGSADGEFGPLTWKAIQSSLKPHGYRGVIDGVPGPNTYKALQAKLGRSQTGRIVSSDVVALQRMLNEGRY